MMKTSPVMPRSIKYQFISFTYHTENSSKVVTTKRLAFPQHPKNGPTYISIAQIPTRRHRNS